MIGMRERKDPNPVLDVKGGLIIQMRKKTESPSIKFRKNGFDFKLLKTKWPYAIYELSVEGVAWAYEVQKLRLNPIPLIKESKYKGIKLGLIKHPGNNEFGSYGWSFKTLKEAEKEYERRQNENNYQR